MHGIEVVYERFHSLISLSSYFLIGKLGCPFLHLPSFLLGDYLFQLLKFKFSVIVVPGHARIDSVFVFDLFFESLHLFHAVVYIFQEVQHLAQISIIKLFISLLDSGSHAVIKIRYRLAAVLIVLVGLDSYTG